jgi:hypothetical protein
MDVLSDVFPDRVDALLRRHVKTHNAAQTDTDMVYTYRDREFLERGVGTFNHAICDVYMVASSSDAIVILIDDGDNQTYIIGRDTEYTERSNGIEVLFYAL